MEQNMTKYWLWLSAVMGTANPRTRGLAEQFDTPKALYYALHDPDCGLLTEQERRNLSRTKLSLCEKIEAYCKENGIGIMTWDSPLYPDRLRHIYNPPIVLFYKGNPALLRDHMLLTVVGTRRPSDYSKKVADWICRDLAKCSLVLVSGLAVGIDAAAHRAAIAEGKPTIGVMGCGVDYDYPKENAALRAEMLKNGLLLSEYFPGTPPRPHHFPARNRILSGISEAVLVIEAAVKSGSLITANLACEQGKQVFCVPPADIFDARYAGVVNFLRDGAYPAFNYLDILYTYYLQYPHKLTLFDEEYASRTQDSLLFAEEKPVRKISRKKTPPAPYAEAEEPPAAQGKKEIPPELPALHRRVLEVLQQGPMSMNALCNALDVSFDEASMLMIELEMAGHIRNAERDIFVLADAE